MEFQSFNNELAIAQLSFQRLFNNIRISRINDKGEEQTIKVNCTFAQRSRILKNLQNPEKRGTMHLPMITINRSGYSRNSERLNNLHNEVKYELSPSNRKYHLMTPIPIDISYDVTIIGKYQQDVDKIMSNFMVFFNSDLYVSYEHPKYEGVKINSQVIMQDSVNEDHPDEFDGSQDDFITASVSFTYKTYLFAGTKKAKLIHPQILSTEIVVHNENVDIEIPASAIDSFQKDHPSTSISALIVFKPDQIDAFQREYPFTSVSATIQQQVSSEITSYVDDISTDIYDDVPIIQALNIGLYNVPLNSEISSYMNDVDNEILRQHYDTNVYEKLANGNLQKINKNCSLDIFKDHLIWSIDGLVVKPECNNAST